MDGSNYKVGIVGCGHLGQAILQALINNGFAREQIYISYKGNPSTHEKIEKLNLVGRIRSNDMIFGSADIIFLAVKPQDIKLLKGMSCSEDKIIISCLAGVSTDILKSIFGKAIYRMMLSGPDTIVGGKGIATIYPDNEKIENILKLLRMKFFKASRESDIDIFTVGVCLPAALLLKDNDTEERAAIYEIGVEFAGFIDIYKWAKDVLPRFDTQRDKQEYIAKMVTKGGVTEAIVESLRSGESLLAALRRGIARTRDISREVSAML